MSGSSESLMELKSFSGVTAVEVAQHVNNPAHSKVLNCSGNTNRAELIRAVLF